MRFIHAYVVVLALALVVVLSIAGARPSRAAAAGAAPPPPSPATIAVPDGWTPGGTTHLLTCPAGWTCCKRDFLGNCLKCAQHGC